MFKPSLNSSVLFVPEETLKYLSNIVCPNPKCKSINCIPIQKLYKNPIEPTNGKGSGKWIPKASTVKCIFCNTYIPIIFPIKEKKGKMYIYCDESKSMNDDYIIFTGCGLVPFYERDIINNVKKIKNDLFGRSDIILHMKSLWNGHERKKIYNLGSNDFLNIKNFINNWAILFKNKFLIKHAIQFICIFFKSKLIDLSRQKNIRVENHEIWNLAFMNFCWVIINILTNQGIEPKIRFEAAQNDKVKLIDKRRSRDVWLKDCFIEEKRRLIYPFITNGFDIPPIDYCKKGTHISLEHADLIAYFTKKNLFSNEEDKNFFSLSKIGNATFIFLDRTNNLKFQQSDGFPKELLGDV